MGKETLADGTEVYRSEYTGKQIDEKLAAVKSESELKEFIANWYKENKDTVPDEQTVDGWIADYLADNPIDGVSEEDIQAAVDAYIKENPVTGVTSEDVENAVNAYLEEHPVSDGQDGEDGVSPTVEVTENADGYTITITDANQEQTFDITNGKDGNPGQDGSPGQDGEPGEDGKDGVGITSIAKTSTSGLVDTYTITFTDGNTTTFTVTNGKDGEGGSGTVTDEQIASAVSDWFDSNPEATQTEYIDYNLNVKAVNHRGYSTTAPENTIPAFILSKQKGFTYVECDVSFTSDGVAVLLHDSTIDRTSDGSGSISSMTYAEALTYDFGSWKSSEYAGTKIATFEEFIMTCKGLGLHPYIELKSNGAYTQEQITKIVDMVKASGMQGKVTYISFDTTFLGCVKSADNKARLGYLVTGIGNSTITTALSLKTDENEVFIDTLYTTATDENVALCIENDLPLEIWTVNSQSVVEGMNNYITGITSDNLIAGKILYNKYSTYTAPELQQISATGITLDASTLTFDDVTSQTLTATVEPTDTTDEIIWSLSDENVATVLNGVVTPISKGSCVITAKCGSVSATCEITVNIELETYSVTRNLTNCTSNNSAIEISEGSSYTETITADTNYTISGATVSVTMGGEDVTETAYNNGVITIDSVSGDIIVTVSAVEKEDDVEDGAEKGELLYNWDFTQSLVDTVSGQEASIVKGSTSNELTQDENGLSFITTDVACVMEGALMKNSIIEVDVASMELQTYKSYNVRFLMSGSHNSNTGMLIWRATNESKQWGAWNQSWNFYDLSEPNAFSGKTIQLQIDENGLSTLSIDGISYGTITDFDATNGSTTLVLGNTGGIMGGDMRGTVITGLRVYQCA